MKGRAALYVAEHVRDLQFFESWVQAPEDFEIVEYGFRDLVGNDVRHKRGRDHHGADTNRLHIGRIAQICTALDDRALVLGVLG